jgi:hypothetical protein|tara:strand:+ start:64 stop:519 length:456 start_codon:yes stop_codon:yes gene_type:complete
MPGTRKVGGKRNATKKGGQWYMPWSQKEKEPVYTHEVDYFPGTKIIKRERYKKDGKLHRDGKPALIERFNDLNNDHKWVMWYKDGKRHRTGGPAQTHYAARTGAIIHEDYWIDGKKMDTAAKEKRGGKTRRKHRHRKGTRKRIKKRSSRRH